jgi:hypothetical protein
MVSPFKRQFEGDHDLAHAGRSVHPIIGSLFADQSMFPCQVADYILTLVQQGERDPIFSKLQRSKSSQARSRCR